MKTNNSEFYHFGVLPSKCIHSPVEDQYSKSYIPEENCSECSCNEWVDSTLRLGVFFEGISKPVHKCKNCNKVRLASLKE